MVQVGVKIWLLGHLRGEDSPRGRQGTSKGQGGKNPCCACGPFWPANCNFHLRFGVPFWDVFLINCGSHFRAASGSTSKPIWTHFGVQKQSKRSPKRSPRAAKTRSQSKTQPNQKYAFRLGGSSIFGSWSGPRRAQLRPRTPFCRPRAFKKEGQKMEPNNTEKCRRGEKRSL